MRGFSALSLLLVALMVLAMAPANSEGTNTWAMGEICHRDGSYVSDCCCAIGNTRPVVRTRRVVRTVTQTPSLGKRLLGRLWFLDNSETSAASENSQHIEPATSSDEADENREQWQRLAKRHLCATCPGAATVIPLTTNGKAVQASSYCCPARVTRFTTVTKTQTVTARRTPKTRFDYYLPAGAALTPEQTLQKAFDVLPGYGVKFNGTLSNGTFSAFGAAGKYAVSPARGRLQPNTGVQIYIATKPRLFSWEATGTTLEFFMRLLGLLPIEPMSSVVYMADTLTNTSQVVVQSFTSANVTIRLYAAPQLLLQARRWDPYGPQRGPFDFCGGYRRSEALAELGIRGNESEVIQARSLDADHAVYVGTSASRALDDPAWGTRRFVGQSISAADGFWEVTTTSLAPGVYRIDHTETKPGENEASTPTVIGRFTILGPTKTTTAVRTTVPATTKIAVPATTKLAVPATTKVLVPATTKQQMTTTKPPSTTKFQTGGPAVTTKAPSSSPVVFYPSEPDCTSLGKVDANCADVQSQLSSFCNDLPANEFAALAGSACYAMKDFSSTCYYQAGAYTGTDLAGVLCQG